LISDRPDAAAMAASAASAIGVHHADDASSLGRRGNSMQKTISMKVVNSGHVGQVLRVPGGTFEVRSGETLDAIDILPLTEAQIAHYRERGVIFEEMKGKKSTPKPAKASSSNEAVLEPAPPDANMAALAEAKTDLDAAEKALDAAKSA
jgi:hypothetical protein